MAQLVEHNLAKVGVAGSNPVVRSIDSHRRSAQRPDKGPSGRPSLFDRAPLAVPDMATWPSGKAEACKAFIPGSNPGVASKSTTCGNVGHRVASAALFSSPDVHFMCIVASAQSNEDEITASNSAAAASSSDGITWA